jgi:hypothetical protein
VHPEAITAVAANQLLRFVLNEAPFISKDQLKEGVENWIEEHFPSRRTLPNPEMTASLESEEMRANPLTFEHLKAFSRSAHAFWRMPLKCPDHDGGMYLEVFSNRTLESHCTVCKKLIGVLLLAK